MIPASANRTGEQQPQRELICPKPGDVLLIDDEARYRLPTDLPAAKRGPA